MPYGSQTQAPFFKDPASKLVRLLLEEISRTSLLVVSPSIYDGFYTSQVAIAFFFGGAPTEGHIQVKLMG